MALDFVNVTSASPIWNDNTTELWTNGSRVVKPGGRGTLAGIIFWRSTIFGIIGTAICVVGILCNIIAIIVLAHFGKKSSAPFLLMCLAISDGLYLMSILFIESIPVMAYGGHISNSYRDSHSFRVAYSLFYSASFFTQMMSIYTVVIITLERYVVVVWPFLAKTLCSLRSACFAILGVVGFSILFHVPFYLAYDRRYAFNKRLQKVMLTVVRNEFGDSHFFKEVYFKWILPAATFLIPFLILLVFNTMMLCALKRDGQNPASTENRAKRERRLTFMVFCMTALFFMFELLSGITFILNTGANVFRDTSNIENGLSAISDLGLLLNSSINFIIYCVSGKKFRDTLKLIAITYYRKLRSCRLCLGKDNRRDGYRYRLASRETSSSLRPFSRDASSSMVTTRSTIISSSQHSMGKSDREHHMPSSKIIDNNESETVISKKNIEC